MRWRPLSLSSGRFTLIASLSICVWGISAICSGRMLDASVHGTSTAGSGVDTDRTGLPRDPAVVTPDIRETSIGPADDCNANGIPDESDLVATFQGLGDLPGGASSSQASAVSADGLVVVGTSNSASGQEAFRWVRASGMIGLGSLPGSINGSEASGVSADGSIVVGRSGIQPFRWTFDAGMVGLGHLHPFATLSMARAVSADGALVVGGDCTCFFIAPCTCEAWRWTSEEGIVGLGFLPSGQSDSFASSVSASGEVVVGYSDWDESGCDCVAGIGGCGFTSPFRWTEASGMVGLDSNDFSPFCHSRANDVAADGSVVVGARDFGAFRWGADDGAVYLGDLAGGPLNSTAKGVSGDGSVVVGAGYSGSGPEAFLWDASVGIRSLRAVLVDDYGLDLSGWMLTTAEDVSRDGRTIVGSGINPEGTAEAWIATLPSTDCNANGVPDECDIVNSLSGDCNADAILDECQPEFDSDGDGFLDSCDACDHSNMEAILLIDDCDTLIINVTGSDGCTLADRLSAACPLPMDLDAHGRFVGCVARLANGWQQEELISSGEIGRIVSCSAHRSRPDQR